MANDVKWNAWHSWFVAARRLHEVVESKPQPSGSDWTGVMAWMDAMRAADDEEWAAWDGYLETLPDAEAAAWRQKRHEELAEMLPNMKAAALAAMSTALHSYLDGLDPFVVETPEGFRIHDVLGDGRSLQGEAEGAQAVIENLVMRPGDLPDVLRQRPFARMIMAVHAGAVVTRAAAGGVVVHA